MGTHMKAAWLLIALALASAASADVTSEGTILDDDSGASPAITGADGGRTFYIDYVGGSDANNGTSTSTPWKRHPYMLGWTGSYTHQTGDNFIFKGGVTWPAAALGLNITASGTSGNYDYYGIDQSWYTGGAWARPIFDAAQSSISGDSIIDFGSEDWIMIEGLDIQGHRTFTRSDTTASIRYDCPTNVIMRQLHVHDWSVTPTITNVGGGQQDDNGQGGIYGHIAGCSPATVWVEYSELENSEWTGTGRQSGAALRGGNCRFCIIHDANTGILHGTMHDSLMYNISDDGNGSFDGDFHTNSLYVDNWAGVGVSPGTTPALIYNNVIHDVGSGSGAIYPNPRYDVNTAIYIWNNVVWNSFWLGAVNIDTYCYGCSDSNIGKVYIWNNTFHVGTDGNGFSSVRVTGSGPSRPPLNTCVMQNNHSINNNGLGGCGAASSTSSNNVSQTLSAASGQGYTGAQTYVYSPTDSGDATVDAGTNLTATQCGTFPSLCEDTPYGPQYSGLFIVAPVRTVQARPGSGAWDAGAYHFP